MKEKIPYFTPEEIDLICYSMWLAVGCLDKKWEEKAKLIEGSPMELSEKIKSMTKESIRGIFRDIKKYDIEGSITHYRENVGRWAKVEDIENLFI